MRSMISNNIRLLLILMLLCVCARVYYDRQLGEKATYEGVKKAGHLVHLERPCAYNRCLKRCLASLHAIEAPKY